MPKGQRGFSKGHTIWNGRNHTEDSKKKLSIAHTGKTLSKEHKKNISISLMGNHRSLGRKDSIETLERKRISHIGKTRTEEQKRKMSLSQMGHKRNLGKHHSLETNRKIGEKQKGEKNHNWKGSITPINTKIRNSIEMNLWRRICMERDHFTDQKTGEKGSRKNPLQVHHINNFSQVIELRTSIENGITLSRNTHKDFHKQYGKQNNTKEQLIEFLNKK